MSLICYVPIYHAKSGTSSHVTQPEGTRPIPNDLTFGAAPCRPSVHSPFNVNDLINSDHLGYGCAQIQQKTNCISLARHHNGSCKLRKYSLTLYCWTVEACAPDEYVLPAIPTPCIIFDVDCLHICIRLL